MYKALIRLFVRPSFTLTLDLLKGNHNDVYQEALTEIVTNERERIREINSLRDSRQRDRGDVSIKIDGILDNAIYTGALATDISLEVLNIVVEYNRAEAAEDNLVTIQNRIWFGGT